MLFTHYENIKCYFHSLKINSYCDLKSCIACKINIKDTHLKKKTIENIINRKSNGFDVKYVIYI